MYVDSGNVVRGYHRTELDYTSEAYYTPYVCGSLSKENVEMVRACQGGYHSATRNTQTTYYAASSYSALSDHKLWTSRHPQLSTTRGAPPLERCLAMVFAKLKRLCVSPGR
jgi:hypothetical protein